MQLRRSNAFTLIEILIVVVLIGVLAAIVVPQFASATEDAKRVAESNIIQTLRNQTAFYRVQHKDTNPTVEQMWDNLLKKTREDGTIGNGPEFGLGPYLSAVPVNPYNGKSNVIAAGPLGGDGGPAPEILDTDAAGFVYDEHTGRIWATRKK